MPASNSFPSASVKPRSAISPRSSGLLISMTSVQCPSPSAPIFTNLKIQATRPPQSTNRREKYPFGTPTPNLEPVPGLSSYPAAMIEIGNANRHEVGHRLNNRAENSHQPFRRREYPMQRFRSVKKLQKFRSVHAQVHNHYNQERHLVTREVYKQRRSAALAEWRALAA